MSTIERTLEWFKEAKPKPTPRDAMVQTGCHFEEVTEMLEQIAGQSQSSAMLVIQATTALRELADDMKENPDSYSVYEEDRVAMLDAICDQLVTASGTGYMLSMEVIDGLNEVNRSNFSKFDENGKAILTTQGKIKKGPNYFEPDLRRFV